MGKYELVKTEVEICKTERGFLKKKAYAGKCQNTNVTGPALTKASSAWLAAPGRAKTKAEGGVSRPPVPALRL